jgi:hypothetical protein
VIDPDDPIDPVGDLEPADPVGLPDDDGAGTEPGTPAP